MAVPLLNIKGQNDALNDRYRAAFERVLASGQYVLGPEVTALESEACAQEGLPEAIAVTSGTDALLLALMALGVGPGDEVIVPAFTFFATAGCVARTGATPVFADIRADDYCLDPASVARLVTSRTKAIVPVHLYGQCARMEEIAAAAPGIPLVEDACQSLGAKRHGKAAGAIGVFGSYSFYPTKNLGALGDGGMLAGTDRALVQKARLMRVHGMERVYYHDFVGGNFRMAAITAALLREKLPHLPEWNAGRVRVADRYISALSALPGVRMSDARESAADRLVLPATTPGNTHIWHQFTVRVPGAGRRDRLRQLLSDRGIGCGVYYPLTLDRQACFARFVTDGAADCPVSHAVAGDCLSLPIYGELTDAQVDEVVAALAAFISAGE